MPDWLRDVLQTVLRMLPWPTEPGLRAIGAPDVWSPVLVTSNYDLTVRRVSRSLKGVDAWLVVAPAGGINVWCAASGGHLGTHQVVTALKTSGVAERVRHRRVILPQLAATGVRAREVQRRCGWRARFGPVYAEDLPAYLERDARKTDAMRHVRFGARERLEMAIAWGAPAAIVVGGIGGLVAPAFALPLIGLALGLALAVYAVYDRLPEPRRALFGGGAAAIVAAGSAAAILVAVLTFDYAGTTPIEGGSHFQERDWHVALDLERCNGVYTCWEVCPEACFEKPPEGADDRRVRLAHDERCVRCGACIVQCPMDALAFEDDAGDRIEPDVIRRFKLNLLGKRTVSAGEARGASEPLD
jgi:ferredoxin